MVRQRESEETIDWSTLITGAGAALSVASGGIFGTTSKPQKPAQLHQKAHPQHRRPFHPKNIQVP